MFYIWQYPQQCCYGNSSFAQRTLLLSAFLVVRHVKDCEAINFTIIFRKCGVRISS